MRYNQIDFFRGLMLVLMSVNHTGGLFSFLTTQPLGFTTAASGFVFLSGLTAGIVYSRKYTQLGSAETSRMILKRSWKIYYYHAGLMLFLITMSILFPSIRDYYWAKSGDFMGNLPSLTFGALILKVQPYFHDILPMYVVFMVFTPLLLWMLHAWKLQWIIAGTLVLWLAAQVSWYLYPTIASYIPGSFNPFAWQLLFFGGVLFGYLTQKGAIDTVLENRPLFLVATTFSVALLVFDWLFKFSELNLVRLPIIETDFFQIISDRKNFGILRLVNFATLVFCIAYVFRSRKNWGHSRWLCLLGRNSLQVFTFHVVLMALTKPLIEHIFNLFPNSMLKDGFLPAIILLLVSFFIPALTTLALWMPAMYREHVKIGVISPVHKKSFSWSPQEERNPRS
jgi:hypothetical protein